MRVNELIKQLQVVKRKFGNIEVSLDTSTVLEDCDPTENYVAEVECLGVFKVRHDDFIHPRKEVILGWSGQDSTLAGAKNLLEAK